MPKEQAIELVRRKAKGFEVVVRCYRVIDFWSITVLKNDLPFVYRVYDDGKVEKVLWTSNIKSVSK